MFGLCYRGRVDGVLSFVVIKPSWRSFWCANSAASTYLGRVVVYRSPTHMLRQGVRQHEITHVQQSRRMGAVQFLMLYRYYHAVHGYRNNPLEKEAREAARAVAAGALERLRAQGIMVHCVRR